MDLILTGCQKMHSQASAITYYNAVSKGVKGGHEKIFGKMTLNGRKIKGIPRVKMNENNIPVMQNAILSAYTSSTFSPNESLRKTYGKYYSIMHDGIQKFAKELNGVHLRTIQFDDDGVKIVHVPWKLSEIPGGSLNGLKLCTHIWTIMSTVNAPSNNAFDGLVEAQRSVGVSSLEMVILPAEIFKCCILESYDLETKTVTLFLECWPVVLMEDGCSINEAASKAMTNMYGLMSPSARCAAHAGDGSIKRMSKSETYSVEEVKTFVEHLRPILRHYQLSGKSTSILNAALEAMDMKPVHMMTWCPTRMSNLLTSSAQTVENLFPICDTLASCDIKVENREYFMSPKGLMTLHLLADLEHVFVPSLLRKVDRDQTFIVEVYGASQKFLDKLNDFHTPLFDEFIHGLDVDDYGNVIYEKSIPGKGDHQITLQIQSRPRRGGVNILDQIKNSSAELREKVIDNLRENIQDQMQEDTVVHYASCFDLTLPLAKEDRFDLARKLFRVYGTEYSHEVVDDGEHMAEPVSSFFTTWNVTIKYKPKLECSEDEFMTELEAIWPVFNRTWGRFKALKVDALFAFYCHIIDNHYINFPNVCELLLILMSFSPNTSPLERSYSKLAKICYKDRNRLGQSNLETLYLLAVHKITSEE